MIREYSFLVSAIKDPLIPCIPSSSALLFRIEDVRAPDWALFGVGLIHVIIIKDTIKRTASMI
jgi:hypothetical protein